MADKSGLVFPSPTGRVLGDSTLSKLLREPGYRPPPVSRRPASLTRWRNCLPGLKRGTCLPSSSTAPFRRGVAARPRPPVVKAETAEAADLDPIPATQRTGHLLDDVLHRLFDVVDGEASPWRCAIRSISPELVVGRRRMLSRSLSTVPKRPPMAAHEATAILSRGGVPPAELPCASRLDVRHHDLDSLGNPRHDGTTTLSPRSTVMDAVGSLRMRHGRRGRSAPHAPDSEPFRRTPRPPSRSTWPDTGR